MSKNLQISSSEVLNCLKVSCKLASVVQDTVRHQIISDAARLAGIEVSDRELQQAADNFRVKYNLYNPATTWQWMNNNYLTGDDFEQLIYESILTSKVIQQLFGDRVEAFFYEHKLDYTKAVLYEVVFDNFNTAIEQFYALEEREVSFIEVARQYIQEPNLRRQYGFKGILPRTAINSVLSAAIFASNPPQILKPIVIGKKVHLILVEEIIEPQLDELLRSQILNQLFVTWLEKQLQHYKIEFTTSQEQSSVCQ